MRPRWGRTCFMKTCDWWLWRMVRMPCTHRYLMSRLSLHVFYLWRHVLLTASPFILWWSNLEILPICPPPPQLSLHRRAPLSSNSNGARSVVYDRKNPKSSLYCEMSMPAAPSHAPCSCSSRPPAPTIHTSNTVKYCAMLIFRGKTRFFFICN
jgi:hypothetical protein